MSSAAACSVSQPALSGQIADRITEPIAATCSVAREHGEFETV